MINKPKKCPNSQMRKLKLWIVNWLDILQRYLIKDQFSNLSRTQLIDSLAELANRHESSEQDLCRQIIQLLDNIEGIARGDLSIRANTTNTIEFSSTGAIHDSLNFFLDDLCELLTELPEGAPLRKKYRLPERFSKGFVPQKTYPEMQLADHEFERFMGKLIRTLDDAEEISRGSLFRRIGCYRDEYDDHASLYDDFYALVDCFNLILDDMHQGLENLPQDHPLRRKYTLNPPLARSPIL